MKPELNNSFCYFPFYQLAVKDFDGKNAEVVAPCCNMLDFKNPFDYFENDQKDSFEEYFYSKPMKKLRKDLLKVNLCCNIVGTESKQITVIAKKKKKMPIICF